MVPRARRIKLMLTTWKAPPIVAPFPWEHAEQILATGKLSTNQAVLLRVGNMQVIYERCCGLDVYKKRVAACLIRSDGQVTRTFSSMTKDLLTLADWLVEQR